MHQILPNTGQAGLCCTHPAAPQEAPRATSAVGVTSPPSPGYRAAAATQCPWHCPTAVPSLHPTVPRRANLPPKARTKGWVPADHSQGPHRSALALGCAQKSSLLSKTLCRESCAAVLSVTHSPSENQQLLPIRSFGDRNSAAKEEFNPCRESPCSKLRKTKREPSAAESHAGEEKPLGRADEGEEQAPREGSFRA